MRARVCEHVRANTQVSEAGNQIKKPAMLC